MTELNLTTLEKLEAAGKLSSDTPTNRALAARLAQLREQERLQTEMEAEASALLQEIEDETPPPPPEPEQIQRVMSSHPIAGGVAIIQCAMEGVKLPTIEDSRGNFVTYRFGGTLNFIARADWNEIEAKIHDKGGDPRLVQAWQSPMPRGVDGQALIIATAEEVDELAAVLQRNWGTSKHALCAVIWKKIVQENHTNRALLHRWYLAAEKSRRLEEVRYLASVMANSGVPLPDKTARDDVDENGWNMVCSVAPPRSVGPRAQNHHHTSGETDPGPAAA